MWLVRGPIVESARAFAVRVVGVGGRDSDVVSCAYDCAAGLGKDTTRA